MKFRTFKNAKKAKRGSSEFTIFEDDTATQPLARQQEIFPARFHAFIQENEVEYSLQAIGWAREMAEVIDDWMEGLVGIEGLAEACLEETAYVEELDGLRGEIQGRVAKAKGEVGLDRNRDMDMLQHWGKTYVTDETVERLLDVLRDMLDTVVRYNIWLGDVGGKELGGLGEAWKVVIGYHMGMNCGFDFRGNGEFSKEKLKAWDQIMKWHVACNVQSMGNELINDGQWWLDVLEDELFSFERKWSVDVESLKYQNWLLDHFPPYPQQRKLRT
jgi:hypothetical protein